MKKIAILGASYLQKPLVEKANQLGYQTHCFAWDNQEAVCKEVANFFYPISVLDKEAILQKCQEIIIDGIVTISTDICIPTISYVAEKMELIANSVHSSIIATNKDRMRRAFELHKVLSPKSVTLTKIEEWEKCELSFPIIIKPTDRSGSRGVSLVSTNDEFQFAFDRAMDESFEKKIVVEEFIDGHEVSVESISWKGKHYILAITDKVTSLPPHFVELQHHQPSLLPTNILNNIRLSTLNALEALEINFGASHSEFKINSNGEVYIIEVGARMGGDFIGSHLVQLSTGYDFLKGVIEISLNNFQEPKFSNIKSAGVCFLSDETKDLFLNLYNKNEFIVEKEIFNKNIVPAQNSNTRSGYLIYQSSKNQRIA
jgi:biotin carboxylase